MQETIKDVISVSQKEWLDSHSHQKFQYQANAGPPGTMLERIIDALPSYVPPETFAIKQRRG